MSAKQGRWLALLVGSVLISASCKKKVEPAPSQPTVSPAAPEPDEPDEPDPSAYGPPQGGPRPSAWAHEDPDLGRPDATTPGATAKKKEPVASDADIAAFKEAKDREDTEKAAEAAVKGALGRVKACFDRHKAARGEYTLSVRVHRSGRVLSSNVAGLGGAANRCVQSALSGLRVDGVKTDTITVTRQLKNW